MGLFRTDRRNRGWRGDDRRWRNRNWDRSPDSFTRYRKPSFRGMLRDFLIRLVAFIVLCALGLAWVKFYFLGEMFRPSF